MADISAAFAPRLTFLSEENKSAIYQSALKVLEHTGMQLDHEAAAETLIAGGCRIEDGRVKMPARLVQDALASAPDNIPIFNRLGEHVMDLGGRRAYFGTGSDLMHHVSSEDFSRHTTRLSDIQRSARLCDGLDNIDFIMSFAHPHDVAPHRSYLESFTAMVRHSIKPIVNTADSRDDLAQMWKISKILRGSDANLREKPYWIQYDEPISPLKHPFKSVDKLIFCAEKGMPVIYSPAPIAGSTAPMTIAGHVVQGLAECLFGLVIHQLTAPGAPFLMGMGAAVLDMATGQCSYNAPEYLMAYMAMVEMSHFFNIPNWGYAGTSDAQIPDGQATFEAGLLTFMASLSGSNLNHDVGYLDFGLTGSLEMVVIMDEVIDQVRRLQQGIPVDEDHLAIDAIAEGQRQGQFLTLPHTLANLRSTQWRPKLFNRQGYEKWTQNGSKSLLDSAREKLAQILESHRPPALDASLDQAIADQLDAFKP